MKAVFLALLMIPAMSYADVSSKPEFARFDVNCVGHANSVTQDGADIEMKGTISVLDRTQTGLLKLGVLGGFEFVADFKFDSNWASVGTVTFSFLNADGAVVSQSTHSLPKKGYIKTAVYYFDTAAGVSADVRCKVNPVVIND